MVTSPPERNDIRNVRTLRANISSGEFSVQFERPFLSNESSRDFNLTLGDT